MARKMYDQPAVVSVDALCDSAGIEIREGDGLMLIRVDSRGVVFPHVLALNQLTEARIEAAIMNIYQHIVMARARAKLPAKQEPLNVG